MNPPTWSPSVWPDQELLEDAIASLCKVPIFFLKENASLPIPASLLFIFLFFLKREQVPPEGVSDKEMKRMFDEWWPTVALTTEYGRACIAETPSPPAAIAPRSNSPPRTVTLASSSSPSTSSTPTTADPTAPTTKTSSTATDIPPGPATPTVDVSNLRQISYYAMRSVGGEKKTKRNATFMFYHSGMIKALLDSFSLPNRRENRFTQRLRPGLVHLCFAGGVLPTPLSSDEFAYSTAKTVWRMVCDHERLETVKSIKHLAFKISSMPTAFQPPASTIAPALQVRTSSLVIALLVECTCRRALSDRALLAPGAGVGPSWSQVHCQRVRVSIRWLGGLQRGG